MVTVNILKFLTYFREKLMMVKKVNLQIAILLVAMSFASCVSKKQIHYFQDDVSVLGGQMPSFSLEFKKDDLLAINVSGLDIEAVKAFNLPVVSYNVVLDAVQGAPKQQAYLIDKRGEINFPVLGKIKLEGLTRTEAIDLLEEKLKDYVKGAAVNINILNFRVNVLGDVRNPGTFFIQNERVTVLDALSLAGDTNISGERIIEIKREANGGIQTGIIDLKSNKTFNSPFFYLQQNDVVYVRPNKAKSQSASFNQNAGVFVSIGSILIALIGVLTR